MTKLLNADSPLMRGLTKMWDLMILNLWTILGCLPVVTAGASLTAMHHVLLLMARDEEGAISREYKDSFKQNLKQGSLIGLLYLGSAVVIFLVYRALFSGNTGTTSVSVALLTLAAAFVFATSLYAFPLLGRYENTIRGTLQNAATLTVACLPKTILMMVVMAAALLVSVSLFRYIVPVIFMIGLTLPGYLCAKLYDPIMKKLG